MRAMALITQANNQGLGDKGAYVKMVRDFYQDMIDQAGDDPDMAELKARSYHRVGFCRMVLRDVAGAEDAYRRSVGLFEGLLARVPGNPTLGWLLASTLNDRGTAAPVRRPEGPSRSPTTGGRSPSARRPRPGSRPTPRPWRSLAWSQLEWAGLPRGGRPARRGRGRPPPARRLLPVAGAHAAEPAGRPPGLRRGPRPASAPSGSRAPAPAAQRRGHVRAGPALDPDDPITLNDIAWALARRPDSPPADLARALELVDQGRRGLPDHGRPLEHPGRRPLPAGRLEGGRRGPGGVDPAPATAATPTTGTSWPWPAIAWATARAPAAGSRRPAAWAEETGPRQRRT